MARVHLVIGNATCRPAIHPSHWSQDASCQKGAGGRVTEVHERVRCEALGWGLGACSLIRKFSIFWRQNRRYFVYIMSRYTEARGRRSSTEGPTRRRQLAPWAEFGSTLSDKLMRCLRVG